MTVDQLLALAAQNEQRAEQAIADPANNPTHWALHFLTKANNYRLQALCLMAQGYTGT